MATEVVPGLGSYQWGDTIKLATSTIADVVGWAIKTGRIPAKDQALWVNRLAGDGGEAYAAELLLVAPARTITFP